MAELPSWLSNRAACCRIFTLAEPSKRPSNGAANGRARDIQHYLADEPVEAYPPSAGYKLRKLARRYRNPLAVTAAFAMLLLTGIVVSTWQAVREHAERERAVAAERKARSEKENAQAALGFLWQDVLSQASPLH